jgi:hypothetical protein
VSEFLANMKTFLSTITTEKILPFLHWLSDTLLPILANLELEDVAIIIVTLFACGSLLQRVYRLSFGQIKIYGMPYWVLQLMWATVAVIIFLTVTDAFISIAGHVHGWVARLVTPALPLFVVLLTGTVAMYYLTDRPKFKPPQFIRLIIVRLLPFEVAWGYKLVAAFY